MAIKLRLPTKMKNMTRRELLAITPGLLLLDCSSAPSPKAAAKPPEPVTGLHALYQMYTFSRTWAQDLKIIRLSSIDVPEVKPVPGKAAAWQAQFASEALGRARTYTLSVYEKSVTLRQGIFADPPASLSPGIRSFVIADAATDSDKAWEVSRDHGRKYAEQHPDAPISYILEGDLQTGAPVWRVIWGLSAASSSFSVLVDAHTGNYLRTLS
jgi:hypothetical protein